MVDLDKLLAELPPWSRWDGCRYRLRRLRPSDLRRRIRWGVQRWRRGYSDCDVWNFDYYLAQIIPQAMRQLSRELHGVPGTIAEECESMDAATTEWRRILETVAVGFEAWTTIGQEYPACARLNELTTQWEEGSALLIKHFGAFWD